MLKALSWFLFMLKTHFATAGADPFSPFVKRTFLFFHFDLTTGTVHDRMKDALRYPNVHLS